MMPPSTTPSAARGPWWTISSFVVMVVFGLIGWVYFFVLNRTRITRPYRGGDGPNLMFVANHQSPLDTLLIVLAAYFPRLLFRRRLHPWSLAATEYWFPNRGMAWLADRLRCLPTRAGQRDCASVRILCRLLPSGITVFFPEGKRSMDGTIGSSHPGAGFVALETGARIVPVAIDGLLDAMPHHRPWPRIGRQLRIAFGDPIALDDMRAGPAGREAAQEIGERCLDAIRDLHRPLVTAKPDASVPRSKPGPFRGKVVWVTGASSGIGRALALELHRQSAILILSSRRHDRLAAVAEECDGDAPVHLLPLDLTDFDRIPGAVAEALEVAGHVDYVIHNAGVAVRATTTETSLAVHRRIMDTNYFGPVALTRAILPSMLRRQSGAFAVVSSIAGRFGAARVGAYAASKHALHGFFESLRAEVRENNIQVSIAMPGFVDTDITLNALTGDGTPYGRPMRAHQRGMSPTVCAQRILAGVAGGRQEFAIGNGIDAWSVPLLRISRRLVAFLVRHYPYRLPEGIRRLFARGEAAAQTGTALPEHLSGS